LPKAAASDGSSNPREETGTVLVRDGDAWHEPVNREDKLAPRPFLLGLAFRVSDLGEEIEEDDVEPETEDQAS
jgi:hypothetical protein